MTGAITKVQGKRKTKVGRVVSDRMDKTIVVSVERLARHRLYKRVIRLTTKFKAHDETNEARTGDTVLIEESRPLSATKRWRLVSVIQRAGDHGLPGEAVVGEEEAVTEAIHAAATLLIEGRLDRVKGCASCRFHFLDESKNRSRRWCSMDDCGARTKSRRYVARRAAARSSARSRSGG